MSIFSVCGLILSACIIMKLVGRDSPDIKMLISLAVIILTAAEYMDSFSAVSRRLSSILDMADINREYIEILLKALGICIVSQLSADCCRDCGESALASQIETVARISLLIIALPLYTAVMDLVISLMGS